MRRGQVLDMDVVADAGSVGSGVVLAKEGHLATLLHRRQDIRDEVRLGRMLLAIRDTRSGRVEVAQDHAPQAVAVAIPGDGRLNGSLRLAIGVDGPDRVRL